MSASLARYEFDCMLCNKSYRSRCKWLMSKWFAVFHRWVLCPGYYFPPLDEER